MRKLAVAGVLGTTLALAMTATPAVAGGTVIFSDITLCSQFPHDGYGGKVYYSDRGSKCAQVYTDTDLNVRTGPGTSYSYAGYSLTSGKVYEFDCWTTGTYVDGDNIWLKVYTAGGARYVTDRYVYTGSNVTTRLRHC